MATFTNRGPYQHQAQVRRKGYPTQTRTFESRRDAEDWAAEVELKMRQRTFVDRSEAERTSFGEILERYRTEVTPGKRGWRAENSRLKQFQRHPLALRMLASLRSVDFSEYKKERLGAVGPKTVCLELSVMSAVFRMADREWSIPIENPIANIGKPPLPQGRERRLVGNEEARLREAASTGCAQTLALCITLAIETGMRRGEIAGLTWEKIDLHHRVIRLDMTKSGGKRIVPLTETAEAAIRALPRPLHGGALTTFHDSNGLGAAFRRACKRAEIKDLHFHDLRHEAASRMARKMPVATLAKVMGWRTLQMAMRYYNPTDSELVAAVRAAA
jgi:integrase